MTKGNGDGDIPRGESVNDQLDDMISGARPFSDWRDRALKESREKKAKKGDGNGFESKVRKALKNTANAVDESRKLPAGTTLNDFGVAVYRDGRIFIKPSIMESFDYDVYANKMVPFFTNFLQTMMMICEVKRVQEGKIVGLDGRGLSSGQPIDP